MNRFLFYIVAYAVLGCGTKVGNPGQPTDTSGSVTLPDLDFSLDQSLDLSLTSSNSNDLRPLQQNPRPIQMKVLMDRVNRIVNETNNIVLQLNNDSVAGVGKHKKRGPAASLGVEISSLNDDSFYQFYAVVCKRDKLFMEVYWNEDETNIKFVHNFRTKSLENQESQEIASEVRISKGDESSLIELWTQGTPWVPSDLTTDGSQLTEAVRATKFDNQDFILHAAKDWSPLDSSVDSLTVADEYLAGTMFRAGAKEFVEFRKDHPNCDSFDETLASPGWCLGGRASRRDQAVYSQNEIDEAWDNRLSEYDLVGAADLKQPSFVGDDSSCSDLIE